MASKRLRTLAAMDADPTGKKARIQSVINVTSQQALRTIMQGLIGDAPSMGQASEIAQARFEAMSWRARLPREGGGEPVELELLNPNLLLSRVVSEVPVLQRWFAEALEQKPSTRDQPWHLLVAWDEFAPGNKLKVDNRRKVMNLCFSFEELRSALSCDVAWFTPVAVRKTLMDQVEGGWSRILRAFLELQLFSDGGLMSDIGVALDLGDGAVGQVFAKPSALLSDGDGLRLALQWMGARSTKPCWRHWNIFKKGGGFAGAEESWEDITCSNPSAMRVWSEADFCDAVDKCCTATSQRQRFAISEASKLDVHRSLGFKATPDGLLAPGPLRRVVRWTETLRYDWVHTLLANGTVTADAWALISACEQHRIATQAHIRAFLREPWQTPSHRRGSGGDIEFATKVGSVM